MSNPDHPVWPILRMLVFILGLAVVLRWNASTFDETELRSIGEMLIVVGAFETGKRAATRRRGGRRDQ